MESVLKREFGDIFNMGKRAPNMATKDFLEKLKRNENLFRREGRLRGGLQGQRGRQRKQRKQRKKRDQRNQRKQRKQRKKRKQRNQRDQRGWRCRRSGQHRLQDQR